VDALPLEMAEVQNVQFPLSRTRRYDYRLRPVSAPVRGANLEQLLGAIERHSA